MNRKRAVFVGIGLASAAALLAWAFLPEPVEVETARVVRGTFTRTVDEDGKTRVRDRFVVSSPLAGTLQRIAFKEGDRIEAGGAAAQVVREIYLEHDDLH